MALNRPVNLPPKIFNVVNYALEIGKFSSDWKLQVMENINDPRYSGILAIFNSLPDIQKLVWEASCHIIMELEGSEKHQIFDDETKQNNALIAQSLADHQLSICECTSPPLPPDQFKILRNGIALWNMVLPFSDEGCIPNDEYQSFLSNIKARLAQFWGGHDEEITTEILHETFVVFKTMSYYYAQYQMDICNSTQKPNENINYSPSHDENYAKSSKTYNSKS